MDGVAEFSKPITTPLGKFNYFSLRELHMDGHDIKEFPFSIRILLENVARNYNNNSFNKTHLDNILNRNTKQVNNEIPYLPSRVLMQDFTGVPSIVDIASIRSEVARKNKNPKLINPTVPVDLIIDHSVMVRGTFANLRLKNELVNKEGGWTLYHPDGKMMTIFDAAIKYKADNIPLPLGGK